MFKQMFDMPPGTVGFEAVGDIDDDDFEDVVAPVLRQQIASGHNLRVLYLLGPQLREFDGDAAQEEFKFAARHACGAGNCVTPLIRKSVGDGRTGPPARRERGGAGRGRGNSAFT